MLHGLRDIAPLLATAVPLGVYNFAEGMSNVESAAAAGDRYRVRQVLTADGIGAIVGSFLGSPFPPAVYIGHPGWKQVGGRIGYSLVTGIVVAVVCFTGLVGTFLAIFPMQALVPVLLYIGLVIGSQANTTSARRYAPAIVLALLPSLAQWATGQIDNALAAAGTTAATVGTGKLIESGVIYDGLKLLGQGAVLVGILLGAIACFVIDRRYYAAAATSVIAAALSFVGLVNAEAVTWNASPAVTIGYLLLAAILAGFGFAARAEKSGELDDGLLFVNGTLMRGLELHGNLAGAELLEETRTAPAYRVHSIGDVHPGMYRARRRRGEHRRRALRHPDRDAAAGRRGRAARPVPRAGGADRRPGRAGHPLRRGHRQDASRDHRAGWLAGVPRLEVRRLEIIRMSERACSRRRYQTGFQYEPVDSVVSWVTTSHRLTRAT